jgi:hypothetical protein
LRSVIIRYNEGRARMEREKEEGEKQLERVQ